jgi:RNA polymerase sigma-70 factor (ECF subfamily)
MHVDEDRPTSQQFNASWNETFARLRSFIAARVDNAEVAADIAQDVLVRNIAAGALKHVDNPTAWLYRSARNAVIDHYRTRHTHQPLDQATEGWPEPDPVDNRPNDATRALAHCLRPLLTQLPETYRDALERVDLAGQSQHAAAAELGISIPGMKSRVQRARRQLKDLLTDCCAVQLDRLGAVTAYHPNSRTCGCPADDR